MAVSSVDAPAALTAPPARRRRGGPGGVTSAFWLFVGPFLVGLIVFVYVPIVWCLVLSFSRAQNTVTPATGSASRTTSTCSHRGRSWTAWSPSRSSRRFIVPLTFALSLGLALLLNQVTSRGRSSARSSSCRPPARYVVASLIWKLSIFNGVRFGLANKVIGIFGIDNVAWLATTDPPWYWLVIVTVRLWLQIGFYMILFLAGLQRISPELYEAAAVDGARNSWQTFRYITFPQLRATSVAVLLLLLITAYQAFDEFFNLLGNSSSPGRRWSTCTAPRRATRTSATAPRARSSWPC